MPLSDDVKQLEERNAELEKENELLRQNEPEPTGFTVEYRDGAVFVDGPYDPSKSYRLMILSDNGNPIQDLHRDWGGWPFEWSERTLPDNPPCPPPPFKWQLQEENYISRRWRNRSQYPADYVSVMYHGEVLAEQETR